MTSVKLIEYAKATTEVRAVYDDILATRKIDSRTAGIYIVAQVVGATLGAVLTYIILIGNDPQSLGLGAVSYNPATSGVGVALAAETIGTAILVFTVFGAAVDGRAPGGFAGILIGFIVYGVIILVGPITGAALNPAREFGPDLVGSIIGATGGAATKWEQLPVYIVGPILGAAFFLLLRESLSRFFTEFYLIPVGVIFIAMVIFMPQGLLGFARRWLNR